LVYNESYFKDEKELRFKKEKVDRHREHMSEHHQKA
jgi:hypothetical protein